MVPVIWKGDIDLDQVILGLPISCDIGSKLRLDIGANKQQDLVH